ncbi:MAG: CaiB/BaiF CoA-transferase family protein [Bacteroidota bacterium]
MFKDLKIIELASVLAGPSVGQFFAELGAEVIKVEHPGLGGDVTRSWKMSGEQDGDISAYFSSINWGKKSLTLNLGEKEGKEILYDLIRQTDIVITSYKPGDAEKFQVDYESLSSLNPKLIYGEITGYGSKINRVGYDAIVQAESGFMYMNGSSDGPPTKMPVALVDVLAGHHLKEAILVALIQRLQSGKGKCVSVSLIDAAISSLINQAANYFVAGVNPERKGSIHPNIAPYGEIFKTKDGKELILAAGNDKQFKGLCQILRLDTLVDDEKFKNNQVRVLNRDKLEFHLSSKISMFMADDLISKLIERQVPAGIIVSVAEALDQQKVEDLLLKSDHLTGLRGFAATGLEISSHLLPPPKLGEHNYAILEDKLGYRASEIDQLRRSGII